MSFVGDHFLSQSNIIVWCFLLVQHLNNLGEVVSPYMPYLFVYNNLVPLSVKSHGWWLDVRVTWSWLMYNYFECTPPLTLSVYVPFPVQPLAIMILHSSPSHSFYDLASLACNNWLRLLPLPLSRDCHVLKSAFSRHFPRKLGCQSLILVCGMVLPIYVQYSFVNPHFHGLQPSFSLTSLPSKPMSRLGWLQTRKALAYRESTRTKYVLCI